MPVLAAIQCAAIELALLQVATLVPIVPTPDHVVDPGDLAVIREFSPPADRWDRGHRGVDVAARSDEPVQAWAAGVVGFSGLVAGKPVITIALDGPGHPRYTYEPVIAVLGAGARVKAGEVIGTLAPSGGHCGGVAGCLHVGLRTDSGYRDPRKPGGGAPSAAVLKPWDEPGRT